MAQKNYRQSPYQNNIRKRLKYLKPAVKLHALYEQEGSTFYPSDAFDGF